MNALDDACPGKDAARGEKQAVGSSQRVAEWTHEGYLDIYRVVGYAAIGLADHQVVGREVALLQIGHSLLVLADIRHDSSKCFLPIGSGIFAWAVSVVALAAQE